MTTDPHAPDSPVGHHNPIDPEQVRRRWLRASAVVAIVGIGAASGCAEEKQAVSAGLSADRTDDTPATTTSIAETTTSTVDTTTTERTTTTAGGADATAAAGESDGGQDVYAVGQTAHTGDFDMTLLQVQDPYTSSNQFDTPQSGHRFVAVEVEAVNTSDEAQVLSTLLGAELSDSQNRPWDTALAGFDLPQLDGDVPASEARRGWIVFEVADDATDLQLRLKGNLTATGSLFDLG